MNGLVRDQNLIRIGGSGEGGRTVKTFAICSNPECSPMAPMTGTILKRKYSDDKTEYRCRHCKTTYDAEVLGTDVCPECGGKMKHPKLWWLECPECGRMY